MGSNISDEEITLFENLVTGSHQPLHVWDTINKITKKASGKWVNIDYQHKLIG